MAVPSRSQPSRGDAGGTTPAADVAPASGTLRLTLPKVPPRDLVVAACLAATVAVAWCAAAGTWSAETWSLPIAYPAFDRDLDKSDVIGTYAYMKASGDGHVLPLFWKNVPELGAPYDGNWNDYPTLDEVPYFLQAVVGTWFGLFAGLNISLLLGHVAAALAFYGVARWSDCSALWSFVAALAFGLAPYIFAQEPHHIQAAYVWPIPFFLLIWRWISTAGGIPMGSPRFWFAVLIGFVSGLHHIYYANILCQLTLLGAAVLAVRSGSREPLQVALAVVGATAAAFVLMNVDTWTFRAVYGPNGGALVREYKWMEIYGLKLVDLVVPPITHHSTTLAEFAASHRASAPLQDEGSYLGVVGLAALGMLVATAAWDVVRRRADDVSMEAWQVLWIVICFSTGGLNAILGAAGFTLFRTGCRYSIVILAVSLLFAARRLTIRDHTLAAGRGGFPSGSLAIAGLLCLVILWDQVPRGPSDTRTTTIARQVASDRDFVTRMEAALPPGAMVFQLPIMEFPESPAPGVPPYDHFRPYLYSKKLRYSFGSMKGRPREQWQQELGRIPFDKAVELIRGQGFSGIYLNRNGFPDKGQQIVDQLRQMGHTKAPIQSETGDLICVPID